MLEAICEALALVCFVLALAVWTAFMTGNF